MSPWLHLTRDERNRFTHEVLTPIFLKYPSVNVRYYDVEAFTTRCSDIALFETASPQDYYYLIEAMRDSPVCTVPYFEFVDIFPALESGFVEYEEHLRGS